jgi:hypothetical protein
MTDLGLLLKVSSFDYFFHLFFILILNPIILILILLCKSQMIHLFIVWSSIMSFHLIFLLYYFSKNCFLKTRFSADFGFFRRNHTTLLQMRDFKKLLKYQRMCNLVNPLDPIFLGQLLCTQMLLKWNYFFCLCIKFASLKWDVHLYSVHFYNFCNS